MLGCVVSISLSSSETFFSAWHKLLMIFNRMGADITRKTSAANSNTSSGSVVPTGIFWIERLTMTLSFLNWLGAKNANNWLDYSFSIRRGADNLLAISQHNPD
jgi:hypothetical protein